MFEKVIDAKESKEILKQYTAKFINSKYTVWNDKYNCPNLPWCYFKGETKMLDIDNISAVNIHSDEIVYCHDERQKILYQTTYEKIYNFIVCLEPWQEVDIELFNETLDWTMAVTHEGEIILSGVKIFV